MRAKIAFLLLVAPFVVASFVFLALSQSETWMLVFLATVAFSVIAYVLIFGGLNEFTFKAMSAEIRFIRTAAKDAKKDSKEIHEVKSKLKTTVQEIEQLRNKLKESIHHVSNLEHKLLAKSQDIRNLERKMFDPKGVGIRKPY